MNNKSIFVLTLLVLCVCSACTTAVPEVLPTYTALPTYTPYPTFTPAPIAEAVVPVESAAESSVAIVRPEDQTVKQSENSDITIVRSGEQKPQATQVSGISIIRPEDQTTDSTISIVRPDTAPKSVEIPAVVQQDESVFKPLTVISKPMSTGGAIQFGYGETSAVVSGSVAANSKVTYSLRAMANQNFVVVLSSDYGTAVLSIYDDAGTVYLRPDSNSTFYNFYLPRTANYYVDVNGLNYGTDYTLQVYIPARVTLQAGTNKAVYNGSLGTYSVVSYTVYAYAGHSMKVDLYTGANPKAFIRVSGMSDGRIYLDNNSYQPSWYTTIPVTQDYLVEVLTLDQSADYRLTFNLN